MAVKLSVGYVTFSFICGLFINGCKAETLFLEDYDKLTPPTVPTLFSFVSPSGAQYLSYAGTCHKNTPDHPQYKAVEKEWEIFKKKTHLKKSVIVAELLAEATLSFSYDTKDIAIRSQSDSGYALWLARYHNLPLIGAELPYKNVIQELLKEFDTQHVHYFCFAFAADFWTRYEEKPDLESFILERVHNWTNDSSITFNYLVTLHETYTDKKFSVPEQSFFVRLMTLTYHTSPIGRMVTYFCIPTKTLRIIYPILRRFHHLRDCHALTIIQEQWKAGNNIFVVYGALHAVALKESLKKLTQQ